MAANSTPLINVLAAINRLVPVTTEDLDGTGEWTYLESAALWDNEMIAKLKPNWIKIAGPYYQSFALIYCQSGEDDGVWLHYLSTEELRSEFQCGIHQVPSWF